MRSVSLEKLMLRVLKDGAPLPVLHGAIQERPDGAVLITLHVKELPDEKGINKTTKQ